jgi:hypothetical protein
VTQLYAGVDTKYKGVQMKSRLEARWAVFFDALGVSWQYEPELFTLPSGRYLPDFRLQWPSGHALWAEVKPTLDVLTARDKARYRDFCDCRVLLLLDGLPAPRSYHWAHLLGGPTGIVLLPTRPAVSLHSDGEPFDMEPTRRAAQMACMIKFTKRRK